MSAAIKCDRVGCLATRPEKGRHVWLRVALPLPAEMRGSLEDELVRDACSIDCAHWLVDELGEHVRP